MDQVIERLRPACVGTTHEGTRQHLQPYRPPGCFDPRPREGATSRASSSGSRSCRFDPRPREGATEDPRLQQQVITVSIRAPVRGRHWHLPMDAAVNAVSIRAPVRGRQPTATAIRATKQFRSAPP